MNSKSLSSKGRGRPPSSERLAASEFLADGEFHPVPEVLDAMMKAIEPTRAIARFNADPRSTNKTMLSLDDQISSGKRKLAYYSINSKGFEVIDENLKPAKVNATTDITKLSVRVKTREEFLSLWDTEERAVAARNSADRLLAERVSVISDEEALQQKSLAAKITVVVRELGEKGNNGFCVYRVLGSKPAETGFVTKKENDTFLVSSVWPEPGKKELFNSARQLAESSWRFLTNPSQGEK